MEEAPLGGDADELDKELAGVRAELAAAQNPVRPRRSWSKQPRPTWRRCRQRRRRLSPWALGSSRRRIGWMGYVAVKQDWRPSEWRRWRGSIACRRRAGDLGAAPPGGAGARAAARGGAGEAGDPVRAHGQVALRTAGTGRPGGHAPARATPASAGAAEPGGTAAATGADLALKSIFEALAQNEVPGGVRRVAEPGGDVPVSVRRRLLESSGEAAGTAEMRLRRRAAALERLRARRHAMRAGDARMYVQA